MKTKITTLVCSLIATFVFGQTTTQTTTVTTQLMRLDSTHVMTVTNFLPDERISVQTAPDTQPVTVNLDHAVAYVNGSGNPVSPSSISAGSKVRLEFSGAGPDRVATRVILINPR